LHLAIELGFHLFKVYQHNAGALASKCVSDSRADAPRGTYYNCNLAV
jgi:hypothetical protein